MVNKKTQITTSTETRIIPYCDQIIIAMLLVIIIAVPLYFDIHLHSVFDLSKITILYVLTFAILAIWSIKTIINCRQVRPEPIANGQDIQIKQHLRQPLILPILAFLFVSGFATVFSINPYLSLVGTYKRYGGFISTIVYISLFFIIIHFIDKKRLRSLLNVIILTACFASIYGILQHFGLDLYHWSTSFGFGIRVSATFGHPAFFSAFLIMVIPLTLIKIFSNPSEQYCRPPVPDRQPDKAVLAETGASSNFRCSTFLYLGILTLLIVAFYYTKTRASFLGLLISNIFFFSLIGKKNLLVNKTKTIVTATIIIGLSIFFNVRHGESASGMIIDRSSIIGRFIDDVEPALLDSKESSPFLEESYEEVGIASKLDGTMRMRVFQYTTGLKIIHDYPVLGIGPDTLGMIYPQYLAKVYKGKNEYRGFENQNRIHSDFLDMAVSRGLLGLGVYLWFVFAYARMVWKGCKKANSSDKALIIGLCASCLAYFIQNQFSFGHIPILTLFWFLIAMSVIASPVRYSITDGMPARTGTDGENPVKHKPELTRWIRSLAIRKFWKRTFCGIIVCLMVLLIILCLFRYKADIYFEHGRRTLNKSKIEEAIQSYEMAVKHNPLALNYRNVLNGIYLKMAETGVNKDSEKIAEELPNLFSREQTTIWFAKAIDGAEKVQKLYPGDYHSAFTLGQAYHILDKISPSRLSGGDEDMSKEAIKYYTKAATLHPFKFEYRNKLARLYAEKGQYEDAIHELKEARSISPSNQAAYLNLAKVYMNDRERYDEAEAVLLEFIEKNPDNEIIDIYRLLSFIYVKTIRWEKVLDQSVKIIQIDREDLEAHKYAIMADFKLERHDDARKLCNRILNLTGQANNTYNKYAKEMLELLSEK